MRARKLGESDSNAQKAQLINRKLFSVQQAGERQLAP